MVALLNEIAGTGTAIIVISSDFEELLGICERVVVISDGMTIADLPADVLTPEKFSRLVSIRSAGSPSRATTRSTARSCRP